jgi:hypothetical protein
MDKEEVFKDFKFQIGDMVQHRTNPIGWIVMNRILIETVSGVSRWYCLNSMNSAGGFVLRQCIEFELSIVLENDRFNRIKE